MFSLVLLYGITLMSKIQFKPGENIHTEPMVPFEFRQVKGVDVSTILIASSGDIDLISWA